ncbi:hypothetical protein RCO48_38890 [Peribacillus frigoritolerans]|nr:hypothetical protein [Peribacillus frigoritolerans]
MAKGVRNFLIPNPFCLQTGTACIRLFFVCFFTVVVIGLKKCAALLLPNYWLAEPPQPLFDAAWQTVGGKGADF